MDKDDLRQQVMGGFEGADYPINSPIEAEARGHASLS